MIDTCQLKCVTFVIFKEIFKFIQEFWYQTSTVLKSAVNKFLTVCVTISRSKLLLSNEVVI